jgi:hypothetical protein
MLLANLIQPSPVEALQASQLIQQALSYLDCILPRHPNPEQNGN